ncbi:MAG: glycosyltransferase family 2 protein [Crocinitomicaceae bacterium]
MSDSVKITVVTVVFNAEDQIIPTIESIISQDFNDYEYIVIDGGSKDRTVELIAGYKTKISKFISEPDKGIYDAMNKGIKLASGEWIYFLNAGDVFYRNDTLSELFKTKFQVASAIVYGANEADYGYFKRINNPLSIDQLKKGMIFSHQAMIVKTYLMKSRLFDTRFEMSADYDSIYHLYQSGYKFEQVNICFASLTAEGASEKNILKTHSERRKIAVSYEKGWQKVLLNLKYHLKSVKLIVIKLTKLVLPKSWVRKLTIKKYRR